MNSIMQDMKDRKREKKHPKKDKRVVVTKQRRRSSLAEPVVLQQRSTAGPLRPISSYSPKDVNCVVRCQAVVRRVLAQLRYRNILAMRERRAALLTELLYTERAYIGQLQTIQSTFMVPLYRSIKSPSPIISEADYERLFADVDVMLYYGTSFLETLEAKVASWEPNKGTVADLCTMMADFAQVYVRFIKDFPALCSLFSQLGDNNTFAAFLKAHHQAPLVATIDALMTVPITRFGSYMMMFKGLIRATWKEHGDYAALFQAYHVLQQYVPMMQLDRTAIVFRAAGPLPAANQTSSRNSKETSSTATSALLPPKSSGAQPNTHRRRRSGEISDGPGNETKLSVAVATEEGPRRKRRESETAKRAAKNDLLFDLLDVLLKQMPLRDGTSAEIRHLAERSMQDSAQVAKVRARRHRSSPDAFILPETREAMKAVAKLEAACKKTRKYAAEERKIIQTQAVVRGWLARQKFRRLRTTYGDNLSSLLVPRCAAFVRLLNEEKEYQHVLQRLMQELVLPVASAAVKTTHINISDLEPFFGYIRNLNDVHASFSSELNNLMTQQFPDFRSLGALLMKTAPHMKSYVAFGKEHRWAIRKLAPYVTQSNEFLDLLNLDGVNDRTLELLLSQPLNRLSQIKELISKIILLTPNVNFPDFAELVKAEAAFQQLTVQANAAFNDGDRLATLREKARLLDSLPDDFDITLSKDSNPRRFLAEGDVAVSEGRNRSKNRHLFLFTDVLIVSTGRVDSRSLASSLPKAAFKVNHVINLKVSNTRLEDLPGLSCLKLHTPAGDMQGSPAAVLTFTFKQESEKEAWSHHFAARKDIAPAGSDESSTDAQPGYERLPSLPALRRASPPRANNNSPATVSGRSPGQRAALVIAETYAESGISGGRRPSDASDTSISSSSGRPRAMSDVSDLSDENNLPIAVRRAKLAGVESKMRKSAEPLPGQGHGLPCELEMEQETEQTTRSLRALSDVDNESRSAPRSTEIAPATLSTTAGDAAPKTKTRSPKEKRSRRTFAGLSSKDMEVKQGDDE